MPTGTVKFFSTDRGYGFITNDDGGPDAFVHITAVEASGMSGLNAEQRVTYEMAADKKGKQTAVNIQSA